MPGSVTNPVKLDPWQTIVEVGWPDYRYVSVNFQLTHEELSRSNSIFVSGPDTTVTGTYATTEILVEKYKVVNPAFFAATAYVSNDGLTWRDVGYGSGAGQVNVPEKPQLQALNFSGMQWPVFGLLINGGDPVTPTAPLLRTPDMDTAGWLPIPIDTANNVSFLGNDFRETTKLNVELWGDETDAVHSWENPLTPGVYIQAHQAVTGAATTRAAHNFSFAGLTAEFHDREYVILGAIWGGTRPQTGTGTPINTHYMMLNLSIRLLFERKTPAA